MVGGCDNTLSLFFFFFCYTMFEVLLVKLGTKEIHVIYALIKLLGKVVALKLNDRF